MLGITQEITISVKDLLTRVLKVNKFPLVKFNTGEVSEELWWRSDIDKYMGSARRLENFIVQPQGAIKRRLGTKAVARLGNNGDFADARIIPWVITRDDYFQLVFTPDGTLAIYNRDGVQVESLAHTYSSTELSEIDYHQVLDVMYLAQKDKPLKDLRRTAQFTFELVDHTFAGGPFLDRNINDAKQMQLTKTATQDEFTVDFLGPNAPFVSTDVGRLLKVLFSENRNLNDRYDTASQGTSSASLPGFGTVTMRTEGGIWGGRLDLEKSTDGGTTWQVIGSVQSNSDSNVDQRNGEIQREIEEFNALVRVTMAERGSPSGDSGCAWYLEVETDQFTYVEISQYNANNQVLATLVSGLWENAGPTQNWSLGAFSDTTGYPRTVKIFEERMMLGGTIEKPSTIYGSQTNNWVDFAAGTLETSAIVFSLSSDTRNTINWMVPEKQLIIGTDSSEWTIGSRNNDKVLSGENITARRHTQYGSEPVSPVQTGDMTMFIEAGGKRLRTSNYSFQDDGYVSNDMNLLANHITRHNNLIELAYTRTPDKIVWGILEDGSLVSFSFEREHNVLAWAKHPMPGSRILSIDSVIGPDADDVGMIIERDDGIYYEVINNTNLCLDWQQGFTVTDQKEIVTLAGNEPNLVYHDYLYRKEEAPFLGNGVFVRLVAPVTTPIIKYAGVQKIEGEDYLKFSDTLFWYASAVATSQVTVFDGLTEILTADKFLGSDGFAIIIDNNSVDMTTAVIKYNGSPLVRDVDFFEMSGARQFLIVNQSGNNISLYTIEDGATNPLAVDDWKIQASLNLISIFGEGGNSFLVGLEEISYIEINDPVPAMGPGTRKAYTEVEVYLFFCLGGEISTNGGRTFDDIYHLDVDVTSDQLIPAFTGKKRLPLNHGYSNGDEDSKDTIIIKNDTLHAMTVAALSLIGRVTGKK
jgi:hypothetical protein